jgi:hypothetical protein
MIRKVSLPDDMVWKCNLFVPPEGELAWWDNGLCGAIAVQGYQDDDDLLCLELRCIEHLEYRTPYKQGTEL